MSRKVRYLKIFVICALGFFYAPAFLLPIFAFNESQVIAFPIEGLSLRWFQALWSEETLHEALKNSLFVAVTASILGTLLGVLTARANSRYDFFGKKPSLSFILIPFLIALYALVWI